jgi:hypothetical protein
VSPYTEPQPPSPRDNSDLPEHRVAMVVFTTVRAVDELDGHGIVRHAIRSALKTSSVEAPILTVMARFRDGEVPVKVHDLVEIGTAAGNGYVWIKPTNRAFYSAGEIAERGEAG